MQLKKPNFNLPLLQNNDIYQPFELDNKSFIIAFNNDSVHTFVLIGNDGYALDLEDYESFFNYGKILLKERNDFFIGTGIGSIFHKDWDNDEVFIELRKKLISRIKDIYISKNFTYLTDKEGKVSTKRYG